MKLRDLFGQAFEGKIIKALTEAASMIVEDAKQNADDNNLPSVVADSISVGEVTNKGDGVYSIDIIVDLDEKTGAPMAAAYEYGSGERGPEGEDYPIEPKTKNALAFVWNYPSPLGRKYIIPADESVVFQRVMHPGVEARPYLQPAIDENSPKIRDMISPLVRLAFREAEPRIVFIRSNQ